MNRPRPRRLINVIKSSDNISSEPDNDIIDGSSIVNEFTVKKNVNTSEISDHSSTRTISYDNNLNEATQSSPVTSSSPKFVPRKPVLATLKKSTAHPPPPTFSSSPRSVPSIPQVTHHQSTQSLNTNTLNKNDNPIPLSANHKSNGEVFIDAADKAAEYIGSSLFNSFKKLNISDSSSPNSVENPFADIMAKLAPSPKDKSEIIRSKSLTLMDEEPPESFNSLLFSSGSQSSTESTIKNVDSEQLNVNFKDNEDIRSFDRLNSIDSHFHDTFEVQLQKNLNPISDNCNSKPALVSDPMNRIDDTYIALESKSHIETEIVSPQISSTSSSSSTGFRASILKHGLSALEKIGKTTADVVVNTRNKIVETSNFVPDSVITPNFFDENSSFYDIFTLYGGHEKLQDLQLKAVKATITSKLEVKNLNASQRSSFDFNARKRIQIQISTNLHADQIMENVDLSSKLLSDSEVTSVFSTAEDEIDCIKRLLKSLDNIHVYGRSEDGTVLVASNRRRHIICQIAVVYTDFLANIISSGKQPNTDYEIFSKYLSKFTSNIIKYLQINFEQNCQDCSLAGKDQQVATKLFLDMTYTAVPQIQFLLY